MKNWRFISTETHSAVMNMALDEVCLNGIAAGKVPPTIRLYRWKPSAVSIGYFQSLKREVDIEKCKELGVDVVRRQTGGGAVYHDYEGELTYSVLAPVDFFPKNIIESYRVICGWIIDALNKLGIESEFIPINDIVTGGKKISGNAQTRRKGVLLQHGTILYKVDVKKMFSLLKIPDEKMRDKMIAAVEERVTSLTALNPELKFEELEGTFMDSFKLKALSLKPSLDIVDGEWSEDELSAARKLASDKYGAEEWNGMR